MKKINENDFISYTIHLASNGCNITFHSLGTTLKEWKNINSGTLYGNKPNGDRAILDSK